MTFIVSAIVGAVGSNAAADTQASAAKNAQQISQQEFQTITAQEQPFIQSGYGAVNELDYLLGIPGGGYGPQSGAGPLSQYGSPNMQPNGYGYGGGSQFAGPQGMGAFRGGTPNGYPSAQGAGGPMGQPGQSPAGGFGSLVTPFTTANWQQLSPMYNFDVQQGRQGVLNTDTAGAGALSGSAMKDLINYNQGAANQSFGQAFNQYQTQQGNIFSRLSGIAQLGQAAATNTGQQGTALAGQAAQSATNVGTAQAAGQIGVSNALASGVTGASYLPWLYANNSPPNNQGAGSGGAALSPDE